MIREQQLLLYFRSSEKRSIWPAVKHVYVGTGLFDRKELS